MIFILHAAIGTHSISILAFSGQWASNWFLLNCCDNILNGGIYEAVVCKVKHDLSGFCGLGTLRAAWFSRSAGGGAPEPEGGLPVPLFAAN